MLGAGATLQSQDVVVVLVSYPNTPNIEFCIKACAISPPISDSGLANKSPNCKFCCLAFIL